MAYKQIGLSKTKNPPDIYIYIYNLTFFSKDFYSNSSANIARIIRIKLQR